MAMPANVARLSEYFARKTTDRNAERHLYGDCHALCYPQTKREHIVMRGYTQRYMNFSTITLCVGTDGVAYRAMFPIRCISEQEVQNMNAFIDAVNARIDPAFMFMDEGRVCLTIGVNFEQIQPQEMLLFVRSAADQTSKALGVMAPFILKAMRGEDIALQAEAAAYAYANPRPEATEEELRAEAEEDGEEVNETMTAERFFGIALLLNVEVPLSEDASYEEEEAQDPEFWDKMYKLYIEPVITSRIEAREEEEEEEEEEVPHPVEVRAWELNLPAIDELPELSSWLGLLAERARKV